MRAAVQGVPRTVLQLVSVACVLIACKHEEVTAEGLAHCANRLAPTALRGSHVRLTTSRCLAHGLSVVPCPQETHPSVERLTELAGFAFEVRTRCLLRDPLDRVPRRAF